MGKKIEKIEVNGEVVYFKKGIDGWNIVNPIKNEDGSWNLKNLLIGGSWFKFGILVAIVILILLATQEYSNAVRMANECLANNPTIILP